MSIPAEMSTARLILEPPTLEAAEAIYDGYAQSEEVVKYLVWRPHASIEQTRSFLQGCIDANSSGRSHPRVIRLKATHAIIGMIELEPSDSKAELGYVLAKRYWGQGIATEAVRALVDTALRLPSLFRIWATCDVDNAASARVLEKAGMEREGLLRRWLRHPNISDEPRDALCYSKVR
jgi:ribosomal-protein-alanine N-acetyltransferase